MLNEVPNNNDVMYVVNTVLKEMTNSIDAMCIANNMHLTTMEAQQTREEIMT